MKVKVNIAGTEHELEAADVKLPEGALLLEPGQTPEGFVSREFMQSEIQRRGKNLARREDLIGDDEFFREAAAQRKIQLGEDGKPVGAGKEVDPQKLFEQWQEQHLKPAKDEAETLKGTVKELREQTLIGQIMQAAAQHGLKKAYLTAPSEGMEPPVVSMFKGAFGYDDESKQWAIREGEGYRYGPNPQQQRYAGASEFFADLQKKEAFKDWFEDRRASSTGFERAGSGTDNKTITRDAFDQLLPDAKMKHINDGGKVVDG